MRLRIPFVISQKDTRQHCLMSLQLQRQKLLSKIEKEQITLCLEWKRIPPYISMNYLEKKCVRMRVRQ